MRIAIALRCRSAGDAPQLRQVARQPLVDERRAAPDPAESATATMISSPTMSTRLSSLRVSTLIAVACRPHRRRVVAPARGVGARSPARSVGRLGRRRGSSPAERGHLPPAVERGARPPWRRRAAPSIRRSTCCDEARGLGAGRRARLAGEALADVVDHHRQHVHGAQHEVDFGRARRECWPDAREIEQVLDLVRDALAPTRRRAPPALPLTVWNGRKMSLSSSVSPGRSSSSQERRLDRAEVIERLGDEQVASSGSTAATATLVVHAVRVGGVGRRDGSASDAGAGAAMRTAADVRDARPGRRPTGCRCEASLDVNASRARARRRRRRATVAESARGLDAGAATSPISGPSSWRPRRGPPARELRPALRRRRAGLSAPARRSSSPAERVRRRVLPALLRWSRCRSRLVWPCLQKPP